MPERRIAIFIHSCFWHRHRSCPLAKLPKSNAEFWKSKLSGNEQRDRARYRDLASNRWRILVIWECAILHHAGSAALTETMTHWIESDDPFSELPQGVSSGD
jgi:DNA mismatch endonuclease (patch repair protein)